MGTQPHDLRLNNLHVPSSCEAVTCVTLSSTRTGQDVLFDTFLVEPSASVTCRLSSSPNAKRSTAFHFSSLVSGSAPCSSSPTTADSAGISPLLADRSSSPKTMHCAPPPPPPPLPPPPPPPPAAGIIATKDKAVPPRLTSPSLCTSAAAGSQSAERSRMHQPPGAPLGLSNCTGEPFTGATLGNKL